MIGEEPPPLSFFSLPMLKATAKDILDAQRNPSSPDIEFKHFHPSSSEPERKIKKINKRSCDICKRKKLKCDNNVGPDEVCTKTTCLCKYHVPAPNTYDNSSMDSNKMSTNNLYENKQIPSADIVPSTTVLRKPGLLSSGHYAGETSFCGYIPPELQPSVMVEENTFPTIDPTPVQPPYITEADQIYLIEVYYENMNPFFPIINKQEMLNQCNLAMTAKGSTYLSPLFFYALFARAAHLQVKRKFTQYKHQTFHDLGDDCITYTSALVNCYKDKPRVSTILALIIMANHLEQTKLPENFTRSWLWAGNAFRLALDLGIHRSFISEKNDQFGQLCVRTFWLAYITDCTFSTTYGRPSATEEKVLDVTSPSRADSDDSVTAEWVDGLNSLISYSKIANRVIKFNYCPPPPFKIQGPVKRHNAFLSSVDSWCVDVMHPNNEPVSPTPHSANIILKESTFLKRLNIQKKLFFYTNLILLHRPYVNDFVQSRNSTRPSYDICAFAAIAITDTVSKLELAELIYHSKSPMTAYAIVMAVRIHIMNASTYPSLDKFNSERNYAQSIEVLERLPQCQVRSTFLNIALTDLRDQYNNRFILAQEREEEAQSQLAQSHVEQLVITTADAIFNPGSTENRRKERPNSINDSNLRSSAESSTSNTFGVFSVIKQYQPRDETTNRKKKQKIGNSSQQQPVQNKRKQKQAEIQRTHQHVFHTTATTTTLNLNNNTTNANVNTITTATFTAAAGQQQQQQQQKEESPNPSFNTQLQQQDFMQPSQGPLQPLFPLQEEQTLQQQILQEQLQFNNSQQQQQQTFNDTYPISQHFLPSPQTFASSSASPASNVQYSHLDYGIIQAQQDYLLEFISHQPLVEDDLSFDFLTNDCSIINDIPAYPEMTLPTWDVMRNENNAEVSITPTSNIYTSPSDPSADTATFQ